MSEQHNTPARVRFGTRDWRHPAWSDTYYPEDLPEDWQFGYYANELSAVLLPASMIEAVSADTLADWVEEAHEDFRFYLDGPAPSAPAAFGDKLGGMLGDEGLSMIDGDLPVGVQAWGDAAGVRLVLLDLAGQNLRARRMVLEQLAPRLAEGEVAIILDGPGVTVAETRELQTVAELLGIA